MPRNALRRLAFAITLPLLLVVSVVSPAAAAEPVQVTWTYPRTPTATLPSVTLVGGGDVLYLQAKVSRPSNVTIQARNSIGAVVRTLASNLSVNTAWSGSWNFTTATGGALADGDYTIRTTATDPDGNVAVKDLPASIDRDAEVTLTGLTANSTVSGQVTLSVASIPGVQITKARFGIGPEIEHGLCASTAQIPADASGAVSGTFLADDCGNYTGQAWAELTFTDRYGTTQTGYSTRVPVTTEDHTPPKLNAISPAAASTYLTSPTTFENAAFSYLVREPAGLRPATWKVTDANGATVATGAESEAGATGRQAIWNGTTNNGVRLPAGTYQVTTTLTDRAGNTTTAGPSPVVVNNTVPATLALDRLGPDTWAAHVTVPTGIAPTDVRISSAPTGGMSTLGPALSRGPNGTYDTTLTFDEPRSYSVSALVHRKTDDGSRTVGYATAKQTVVAEAPADNDAPVVSSPRSAVYFQNPTSYGEGSLYFQVQDASPVTHTPYVFRDATGAVVDAFIRDEEEGVVAWEGKDRNGRLVPGGTYTVSTTFTDAAGHSTAATGTFVLEDTPPATFDLSRTTPEVYRGTVTPRSGADVRAVTLIFTPTWNGPTREFPATKDPAGRWVAEASTAGWEGQDYDVYARISRGTPGSFYPTGEFQSATTTVTVAPIDSEPPVATTPAPVTQFLYDPTRYMPVPVAFVVSDKSRITQATGWVTDASGRVVLDSQALTSGLYTPDRYPLGWDGRLADGTVAPAGAYAVHARFTDEAGNTATATPAMLTLDDRIPATLTRPTEGEVMMGFAPIEVVPTTTAGTTLVSARVCVDNRYTCGGPTLNNPSPDGIWRTTWPVGSATAGEHTVYLQSTWKDGSGVTHQFTSAGKKVVIDPTTIPVEVETTQVTETSARTDVDTSSPTSEDLTVTMDWGDGSAVERRSTAAPYPTQSYTHTYNRAGTFTQRVTVAGSSQSTTKTETFTVSEGATPPPASAPPSAPRYPKATRGNQTITMTWTPATGPVASYDVAWSRDGKTWSTRKITAPATSAAISGLVNGVQYRVRARAANSAGTSTWTGALYATPDAPPPPVASVQGAARPSAALISWTPGTMTASHGKTTAYMIYRYRPADQKWVQVRQVGATARSTQIGMLDWRKTYRFQVRASNAVGKSAASAVVTVTPRRP